MVLVALIFGTACGERGLEVPSSSPDLARVYDLAGQRDLASAPDVASSVDLGQTCAGEPLPAEICTDEGWACDTQRALEICPPIACATCARFSGPVDNLACACRCTGDHVLCHSSD